jgi:beta-lactamase regulating signal transducer with metallopeptidase domain
MVSPDSILLHVLPIAAQGLVSAIWESALLVLFVAGCLQLLQNLSAAARSLVWTGTFIVTILLPFTAVLHSISGLAGADHSVGVHAGLGWAYALVGIWVAVSLIRGVQLIFSALHLRGIARRATPIVDACKPDEFVPTEPADIHPRTVQICSSDEVDAPSVVGFFKPQILIPTGILATMSQLDLRQIVLHEMEHLRRRDDWTNLIQKIGLVLFPINPALLWVERRLCTERELACDDGVLRATGARKAYATCLVNLAEQSLMRRGLSLALGAWQHRSELARRVHRILGGPQREMGRPWSRAIVGMALVSLLGGAAVLTQTPQLVSFEGYDPGQSVAVSNPVAPLAPVAATNAAAHATLVSAHLPNEQSRSAVVQDPREMRRKSVPIATKVRRHARGSNSMVLVRWDAMSRTTYATPISSEDSQFIYAAVPVRNGWLIVKL